MKLLMSLYTQLKLGLSEGVSMNLALISALH